MNGKLMKKMRAIGKLINIRRLNSTINNLRTVCDITFSHRDSCVQNNNNRDMLKLSFGIFFFSST